MKKEELIQTIQLLLNFNKRVKGQLNASIIEEIVMDTLPTLPVDLSGDESKEIVSELILRNSHTIDRDKTLVNNEGHEDWLIGERKEKWFYWSRYKRYLEMKLSNSVVDRLDESTDEVLGLFEDPERDGAWDRRGLIVGHVQSGKTSHYSGLICKAADAGYKIIIVLAGMHNNLRVQTQIRLEEAFLGFNTDTKGGEYTRVGVGLDDGRMEMLPNTLTTRKENGDFTTAQANRVSVGPEEKPWLFVVKKNKTVLKKLLNWIGSFHVSNGEGVVTRFPLLLIDDEADHASVDTGDVTYIDGSPDENYEPRAINSLIRQILKSFQKSAFVGYTATPFANVFIKRQNETAKEGRDLFPESFIKTLAAPDNYIGPSSMFGVNAGDGRDDVLPLLRDVSDHGPEDLADGWMPLRHKKTHIPTFIGSEKIPPSLEDAVLSFLISCSVRSLRGDGQEHCSMLVHVTRFLDVQHEVEIQVRKFFSDVKQRLTRQIDNVLIEERLKRIWSEDFCKTSAEVKNVFPTEGGVKYSWEKVHESLVRIIGDIKIMQVNGSAKVPLDYDQQKSTGLKVIAIGGDKLARGLTLEGLTISYFVRTSKMYDTLMQMGRWFGYRDGYLDLCRLYTTTELTDWYGHITDAADELRGEFEEMFNIGATPRDYGLKVRSHPVMMVTSPLKMRSAESLKLNYSRTKSQTVTFGSSTRVLSENYLLMKGFLDLLGKPKKNGIRIEGEIKGNTHKWDRSFLWDSVASDEIINFLNAYQSPREARAVNGKVIAEFIRKMNEVNELTDWTIAFIGQGKKNTSTFNISSDLVTDTPTSRSITKHQDRLSISTLTDPHDEYIDLSAELLDDAYRQSIKDSPDKEYAAPRSSVVRAKRDPKKGLLLLYLVTSTEPKPDWFHSDTPLVGFAVSFPGSPASVQVEYKVDQLLWDEYGSPN